MTTTENSVTVNNEGKRPISRIALIRMLIVLTLDVIAGVLLMLMSENVDNFEVFFIVNCVTKSMFSIICGSVAVLAAAAFVILLLCKVDMSGWYVTPLMIAAVFAFVAVTPVIFLYNYLSRYLITVLVLVIASVLYFAYNLFVHIFYK